MARSKLIVTIDYDYAEDALETYEGLKYIRNVVNVEFEDKNEHKELLEDI